MEYEIAVGMMENKLLVYITWHVPMHIHMHTPLSIAFYLKYRFILHEFNIFHMTFFHYNIFT